MGAGVWFSMGETILIVEDEAKMRTLLVDYLSHAGYRTVEAADGEEAADRFRDTEIDLVLLDIMMPRKDGFAVCQSLRSESDVLIVLLTARSAETDKLHGYELGADDYVTKPFSPKVLVAKIGALLKRRAINSGEGPIRLEGLELNPAAHELRINGEPVVLSRKEYELLICLTRNRNRTLSRDQLLDQVWGFDYEGDPRTVDTHVKRLRRKLGSKARLIDTVKGYGYKLKVSR